MSYVRAEAVLPQELIETIQQYVSGTNIYIFRVKIKNPGEVKLIRQAITRIEMPRYAKSMQQVFQ